MALLEFTSKGIYCPRADVFIDPWRKVDKALITHGHSDHAYRGHAHYLCAESCAPVLRHRLGKIDIQPQPYGKTLQINGVTFSFHPAGHVIGSAQIRVEYSGEIWVASGDYKTVDDGISEAFEPVPCHTFITESTFGLPVYRWQPQAEIFRAMNAWWHENRASGTTSVISAYSLGKAQRILANIDISIGPVYCHPAVEGMNAALRAAGVALPKTRLLTEDVDINALAGSLIIGPSAAISASLESRLAGRLQVAAASGWMMLRKARRQRALDFSFTLSDHADWDGLNTAIKATGAETVFVTHGSTKLFSRWLREQGYDARIVKTSYEGEEV